MEKGYDRFLGFADTYDEGRPKLPGKAIEILKNYKNDINLIVDIGCGTGNSTQVCTSYANRVIGIEPSEDMLSKAKEKKNEKLTFKKGLGDNTGLDDNIADIVICSQAFHWMNPQTTITEVCRILKEGGIFAVIDADYIPIIDLRLEMLIKELHSLIVKNIEDENDIIIIPQSKHLENMINSNMFKYCKEICFDNEEEYDKERFKKYLLSKSGIQKAIKNNYTPIIEKLDNLDNILDEVFQGKTLNARFSYKMKIGVK